MVRACQLEAKGLRELLRISSENQSGPGTAAGLCEPMPAAVTLGKEVLSAVSLLPKELQCRLALWDTESPDSCLGPCCPHFSTQRADQAGGRTLCSRTTGPEATSPPPRAAETKGRGRADDNHATLARQRHQSQGSWPWTYMTTLIQEEVRHLSLPGV